MKNIKLKNFKYFIGLSLLFLFHCDSLLDSLEEEKQLAKGITFAIGAPSTSSVKGVENSGVVYLYGENGNLLNKIVPDKPEEYAFFGDSVAFSQDRIAISAPHEDYFEKEDEVERKFGYLDAGAVYLYDKNGQLIRKLHSNDMGAKDYFGYSLAFMGDKLLVGCLYETAGKVLHAGVVYLFDKDGNFIKKLISDSPKQFSEFSRTVVASEDRVLVGAYKDNIDSSGAAYLFDEEGNFIKKLTSDMPQARAEFGRELAIFEDIALVAVSKENVNGNANSGAVYLFNKGNGNLIKKLILENPQQDAHFGHKVTFVNEKIVISAYTEDINGKTGAGAVYLYTKSGNLIKKLTLDNPEEGDIFGASVVSYGDNIIIGSARRNVDGVDGAGAVYLFNSDGELIRQFTSKNPQSGNNVGLTIAIKGDKIIVGDSNEDVDGVKDSGSAYLFNDKGVFIKKLISDPIEVNGYFGSRIITN